VVRKRNEDVLSGERVGTPTASCWPKGVTGFLLSPMTQPMYFIQGPNELVMILTSFNDVRHVHLTDKHSANVKTSWYGESMVITKAIHWSLIRSVWTRGHGWTDLVRRTRNSCMSSSATT
jgi:hypothetical protein